jgi:hypothetical protein
MVEIGVAISIASSAYNAIRGAVERGREAQELVHVFSKFFDASDQISEASIKNSKAPNVTKLFSGSSVESQALEITAARHKIMAMEKELRDFLIYSGQSAFYEDMMEERKRIRRRRILVANKAAEKRAFYIDMVALVVGIGVSVATIVFTVSFIASAS